MKFLFRIFIFICFGAISTSLMALPPLFEAIKAWEEGDDKRAANLFHPLRKVPVARPYCMDLIKKGHLKDEYLFKEDDFQCLEGRDFSKKNTVSFTDSKIARSSFEASSFMREINACEKSNLDEGKKSKKLRSLRGDLACLKSAPAYCMRGKHIESIKQGLQGGFLDFNCLLAIKNYESIKVGEEELKPAQVSIIERLIEKHSLGDAFFQLSKIYPNTKSPLRQLFIRTAAYYGSCEAQRQWAFEGSTNFKQHFFWTLQAAEQEDSKSLDIAARAFSHDVDESEVFPIDKKRSLLLSKLAVERNVDHLPHVYYRYAFELYEGNKTLSSDNDFLKYFELAVQHGGDHMMQLSYAIALAQNGKEAEAKKILIYLIEARCAPAIGVFQEIFLDPDEFVDILPSCLALAEKSTEVLYETSYMILMSSPETIDKHKGKLFGLLEKAKKSPRVQYFKLHQALLLMKFNSDNELVGNHLEYLMKASQLGCEKADYHLGEYYEELENYVEALIYYEQGIKRGMVPAYYAAGHLLYRLNDPKKELKAIEYLKSAYEMRDDYENSTIIRAAAAELLGDIYYRKKGRTACDTETAKDYWLKALALNCQHVNMSANARLALFEANEKLAQQDYDFEKSRHLLEEGVRLNDDASLLLMGQLILFDSKLSASLENRKIGIAYLRQAITQGCNIAKSAYLLFATLGVEGVIKPKFEKIKIAFQKLDPEEKEAYLRKLGVLIPEFETALKETPEDDSSYQGYHTEDETVTSDDSFDEDTVLDPEDDVKEKPEDSAHTQENQVKLNRLLGELEGLTKKKQVKWSKVKNLIGKVTKLKSGVFKPGKGSGFKMHIGEQKTGLHIPHGKNPSELSGGRLESVRSFLEINVHNNNNNNEAEEAPVKKEPLKKKKNNKKGRKKK